eukprot:6202202-Pleurochrysis_carterae.AAC.1
MVRGIRHHAGILSKPSRCPGGSKHNASLLAASRSVSCGFTLPVMMSSKTKTAASQECSYHHRTLACEGTRACALALERTRTETSRACASGRLAIVRQGPLMETCFLSHNWCKGPARSLIDDEGAHKAKFCVRWAKWFNAVQQRPAGTPTLWWID